ncbi:hypothetical protein SAMN06265171_11090 [Chryseobacterium rhizoplanae]|uniref:Uncharacterized protein n=1 Tax=Chryseobacterium rhizoplanae TaxID=1609531 RepID=A0A521EX11_9FLAO|nr:hypothetical protein SAMN06265171_11090 [Chryseobacterium rhizoplanae]
MRPYVYFKYFNRLYSRKRVYHVKKKLISYIDSTIKLLMR